MRYVSLFTALLAIFAYTSAQATQIINADDQAYTVTIVTPAGEDVIEVAPEEILDDVCTEGCTLILGDQDEAVVTADDTVIIENGMLEIGQ